MILKRKKTRKLWIRSYRDCYLSKFKIENHDYEFRIFGLWEKYYSMILIHTNWSNKREQRLFSTYDLKLCQEYASGYASWLKSMYLYLN